MQDGMLIAQLAVSSALAGLGWVVQLAVYAHFGVLLREAGAAGFRRYHAAYTRSMGWVAAPLMLAEAALAGAWCVRQPDSDHVWCGAAGVVIAWLVTFGVAVPLHGRLQAAPTDALARRLVGWHLVRTLVWTVRAAGLGWVLAR